MDESIFRNPEFTVHMLNEDGKTAAREIRDIFDKCLNQLEDICPDGRAYSIVRTKLEEACFFAKKSIANMKGYQEENENVKD